MFRKKNKPEEKSTPEQKKAPVKGTEKPRQARPAAQASKTATPSAASQQAPAEAQQQQVTFDESDLVTCYANFCRITGTPEEVILDLGLNPQSIGAPVEGVQVSQRVIVNYYTAKRMLNALHATVSRHEQAFGSLETDVRNRVIQQQTTSDPAPAQ